MDRHSWYAPAGRLGPSFPNWVVDVNNSGLVIGSSYMAPIANHAPVPPSVPKLIIPFVAVHRNAVKTIDAAGNSVTGTFEVIVKDAPQHLADTIALIASYNLTKLGTSLPDKLQIASAFAAAGQVIDACGTLTGFLNQVRAQTGKALTTEQATELTMRGIRIQHVIGC